MRLIPVPLVYRARFAVHARQVCNYNPAACEDDKCMESSTSELEYFVHSPHATMLPGVSALTTGQIQEALRANGGVQVSVLCVVAMRACVYARACAYVCVCVWVCVGGGGGGTSWCAYSLSVCSADVHASK
jgi:hypothetical protein